MEGVPELLMARDAAALLGISERRVRRVGEDGLGAVTSDPLSVRHGEVEALARRRAEQQHRPGFAKGDPTAAAAGRRGAALRRGRWVVV